MRVEQGGTQMYCPTCKKITVCKGLSPSDVGKKSGQRWYRKDHPDVQWFRRGRECQTCGEAFVTAEAAEKFIDELVELRQALGKIKGMTESYMEKSAEASTALTGLSSALEELRALDIYKTAGKKTPKT